MPFVVGKCPKCRQLYKFKIPVSIMDMFCEECGEPLEIIAVGE